MARRNHHNDEHDDDEEDNNDQQQLLDEEQPEQGGADVDDDDDDDECQATTEVDGLLVVGDSDDPNGVVDSRSRSVEEFNDASDVNSTGSTYDNFRWLLQQTLLPDDQVSFRGIKFVEGPFAIKLLKFTILTFGGIWTMYYIVRYMGWEHDPTLRLNEVWRYEGNLIITDLLFFFVIGRLFKKRGVDNMEFLFLVILANFYSSYITDFKIFQHSFTLYEMHCKWPYQLWIFVLLVIPILVTVGILHFRQSIHDGIVVQKCIEMIFCLTFLLLPLIGSSYFHLHHWYAGLLVGMHFNFDIWWSRMALAWCWGCYINGIAVYGRDPVLTCAYALFMSKTQRCPFVNCYLEAMANPDHLTADNVTVDEMKTPDWRNCSADAYHP